MHELMSLMAVVQLKLVKVPKREDVIGQYSYDALGELFG